MTVSIRTCAAPVALAAALAFGLSACGGEDEPDTVSEAADQLESEAEDLADSADELSEMAEEAQEDAEAAMEAAATASGRTAAPADARVYFQNLADGDVVSNPVRITFGAEGIGVTEAGDQTPNTGHHHLLIDVTVDDLDTEFAIPNDANHVHFGDGSTSTEIALDPGEHTLQLVMGDWSHIPHDPIVASEVITVTVRQ